MEMDKNDETSSSSNSSSETSNIEYPDCLDEADSSVFQQTGVPPTLEKGDVVLVRNPQSDINPDRETWSGPYIVEEARDGVCDVKSAGGKILQCNIEDVKLYMSPRMTQQLALKWQADNFLDLSPVKMTNKSPCKRKSQELENDRANKSVKVSTSANTPSETDKCNIWIPNLNLTQEHKRIIENGHELTSDIIDAAQALLKRQYNTNGLESCLRGQTNIGYNPVSAPSVQIHFDETRQSWVTSVATLDDEVIVCDNLESGYTMSESMKSQLWQLYGSRGVNEKLRVSFLPDINLKLSLDYGAYAIAYAVECLEDDGDLTVIFDPTRMRSHLIACLESSHMELFPRILTPDSDDDSETDDNFNHCLVDECDKCDTV